MDNLWDPVNSCNGEIMWKNKLLVCAIFRCQTIESTVACVQLSQYSHILQLRNFGRNCLLSRLITMSTLTYNNEHADSSDNACDVYSWVALFECQAISRLSSVFHNFPQRVQANHVMRDCGLPLWCKWDLRCSGILLSVDW